MLKQISLSLFVLIVYHSANAQTSFLDVGIRLQKDVGLYYENGIAINYSNKNLAPDRLYFGFSYASSRLGTALGSNAIKQDNFLLSSAWYFRRGHVIRPFVRANVGYFESSYASIFEMLPHNSTLLAADAGFAFQTHTPLKIAASFGDNFIYGQGNNNTPGTLYPFFYQLTLSWSLLHHNK